MIYVIETHHLAIASEGALTFERRRYDDEFLDSLRAALAEGVEQIRKHDFGTPRLVFADVPHDYAIMLGLIEDGAALSGYAHTIGCERGVLARNGLGGPATEAVSTLHTGSRVMRQVFALSTRTAAQGPMNERLPDLASAWDTERATYRLPEWIDTATTKLNSDKALTFEDLAHGIDDAIERPQGQCARHHLRQDDVVSSRWPARRDQACSGRVAPRKTGASYAGRSPSKSGSSRFCCSGPSPATLSGTDLASAARCSTGATAPTSARSSHAARGICPLAPAPRPHPVPDRPRATRVSLIHPVRVDRPYVAGLGRRA